MSKFKWVLCAGAAALVLTGCERSSAVASNGGSASAPTSAERSYGGGSDRAREDRSQVADADVPMVAGKPMWSSSRKGSAEENAQRSFERNGEAFGASDLDAFVRKAHAFVDHPPAGTETLKRANGDTLYYDGKDNIFAVANKDGVPRTMFKPDEGAAYWDKQKTNQGRRETARADRKSRAGDEG
jgi:pyocin large subunit-like protein